MNTSVMGVGFIGKRYCELYPDSFPERSGQILPLYPEILYTRSTTSNYNIFTDLHKDINVNLTDLVCVLPNIHNQGTFNFLSSWFCYGNATGLNSDNPAKESDFCNPNGFYSITKFCGENLIRSYCETFNKNYRIIRLCNVIGNDPNANKQKNALEYILKRIKNGEDVEIYTGDNWRNFLHVDDVCYAIRLVQQKGKLNEIYNIGNLYSYRIIDLIEYAKSVTGSKSRINLQVPPHFHKVVQVPNFWMDTKKIRGLGFNPTMSIYQAIDKILANI